MIKPILFTILALSAQAGNAMSASMGEIAKSWSFNDFGAASGNLPFLGGASATIVYTGGQDEGIPTVIVNTIALGSQPAPAGTAARWERLLFQHNSQRRIFTAQKVRQTADGWRYYAEFETPGRAETGKHVALLAMVKDGKLVVLTFTEDADIFYPHLDLVKKLYAKIQIKNP